MFGINSVALRDMQYRLGSVGSAPHQGFSGLCHGSWLKGPSMAWEFLKRGCIGHCHLAELRFCGVTQSAPLGGLSAMTRHLVHKLSGPGTCTGSGLAACRPIAGLSSFGLSSCVAPLGP